MKFLPNKNTLSDNAFAPEMEKIVRENDERLTFLLLTIRTLLVLIKNFSVDLKELKAPEFKQNVDRLSEKFVPDTKTRALESVFESQKKRILKYSQNQKAYIEARELELKDIIDLLTQAVTALNTDNGKFNKTLFKQSEQMEKIALLDDIKKIKTRLKQEIDDMRSAIADKHARDQCQVDKLSGQVDVLRIELEKAKTESLRDGLTGINNRLALNNYIQKLVEKNSIHRSSFSLLMMDIDDFKKINDRFGHQTGDRVLLAVVEKCRECIRAADFFARYGGEEFVLVLPGASLRNAAKKARHLCKTIAAARYRVEEPQEKMTLSFTISIGVSRYRKGDTLSSVIKRADKALYQAKRSGKNQIITEKQLT